MPSIVTGISAVSVDPLPGAPRSVGIATGSASPDTAPSFPPAGDVPPAPRSAYGTLSPRQAAIAGQLSRMTRGQGETPAEGGADSDTRPAGDSTGEPASSYGKTAEKDAPGGAASPETGEDAQAEEEEATASQSPGREGQSLTEDEKRVVFRLQARDREVRTHEQAHLAAAGGIASGGARLQYQTGPDGQRYAVGGEVSIDVSPGRTPQETMRKMRAVRRAALAPAQPSGQDRRVAAEARLQEMQAQRELMEQQMDLVRGQIDGQIARAAAGRESTAGEAADLRPAASPDAGAAERPSSFGWVPPPAPAAGATAGASALARRQAGALAYAALAG